MRLETANMPGRAVSSIAASLASRCSRPVAAARVSNANGRFTALSSQLLPSSARTFSTWPMHLAEARTLNTEGQEGVESADYDDAIARDTKQIRTPWHREGSNVPPVSRARSAGAMTKGKLLTTPSRLLKLIIPLTTLDHNDDRKSVEPLALLVHPQQPLSYLERLIQSELPILKNEKGEDKIPAVYFRAEDASSEDELMPISEEEAKEAEDSTDGLEETRFDGKIEKTGVLNAKKKKEQESTEGASIRGGPGEGGVETYSGRGREGPSTEEKRGKFVRWSSSTDIGDFIRDAARGKEFAVEIEGADKEIRIGVPSFNDRTHYLRSRLRRIASKISEMAAVKKECDHVAHMSAQRVAMAGFGALMFWWIGVYYLTFQTELGWDTMEPVTYLVGLSGLMCGYLWFLYHNREVSYRSAMNLTISRRQATLYAARGFDSHRWEELVREGNAMRSEIKAIAAEYDVDWNEAFDEQDKAVTQALKEHRDEQRGKGKGKGSSSKEEEEDEDEQDKGGERNEDKEGGSQK